MRETQPDRRDETQTDPSNVSRTAVPGFSPSNQRLEFALAILLAGTGATRNLRGLITSEIEDTTTATNTRLKEGGSRHPTGDSSRPGKLRPPDERDPRQPADYTPGEPRQQPGGHMRKNRQ